MPTRIIGREAIETLAKRFPQLYVAPAEGMERVNRRASTSGVVVENANLSHFVTTDEDELRTVDTPAGPVEVLFLQERKDFETFLQIISHKSQPVPIARTIGAITYRGLPDWSAVADAKREYLARGGDDWSSEFARLAKQPGAFRAELIVISEGPYSNIPADETPYCEEKWLRVSREVRLHHECAHVVCRRTMPDDILPVWDEVTADVVGLLFATGEYDASLAANFLGAGPSGFTGGRLYEYLDEDQKGRVDDISADVYKALVKIEERVKTESIDDPFSFLVDLKRSPIVEY